MTFFERYQQEQTWYGKVIIIEIYHLARTQGNPDWTITMTARDFGISVGLASENLRLAKAMHRRNDLFECQSRTEALKRLG